MNYPEDSDHTFIIRIWKEGREITGATPAWRGAIEHVLTGNWRSLQDAAHIVTFIHPYLEAMGVKTAFCWRWTVRLMKLKQCLRNAAAPPEAAGTDRKKNHSL